MYQRFRIVAALLFAVSIVSCQSNSGDLSSGSSDADTRAAEWLQHDTERPFPERVPPNEPNALALPPVDATVLIPEDANLDEWESVNGGPAPWTVAGGVVVVDPGSGPIQTRASFGDMQLHIEWKAADEPSKTGQDKSNSGVFLIDDRYEIQILDTHENLTYADGSAGAIYGQHPPLANALRPTPEWQTYDIFFRGPRFGDGGGLQEPARLTVLMNGILVQNNEVLPGMTTWLQTLPYAPHPRSGRIQLQDHGSPVSFRNVWVRETPDRSAPPEGYGLYDVAELSDNEEDRLIGTYLRGGPNDTFVIERTADGLAMSMPWREGTLPMIPLSATEFQLENTAGVLTFDVGSNGSVLGVTFEMGGGVYMGTRSED
ncbi:MAG: DUF1080 domain-containing protein [Rhodothermales bacterium]|nr:DUF1080 domain-containing protein [Rhodothermales bacterium]